MGSQIVAAGHRVLQVVARREAVAAALAAEWGCGYTTRWDAVDPGADLYIVSLSDRAIPDVSRMLSLPGRLVVHTAGAVPLAALQSVSERHGVLYPLQSLRKEIRPFPEFPLLIDAAQAEDLPVLAGFARTIARSPPTMSCGSSCMWQLFLPIISPTSCIRLRRTSAGRNRSTSGCCCR
jgi:hypothetical protein